MRAGTEGLNRCYRLITALLLALAAPLCVAAQAQPAGFVIVAEGKVTAIDNDHVHRGLERRSEIFPGETIQTGPHAKVQLKFRDGSIMALEADTTFAVERYRYTKGDAGGKKAEGESFFNLIKGGLRTVTGSIGKDDPDDYKLETPLATIGIRGTHYEAVVANSLSVAVWKGGVTVTNEGGDMRLGGNQDFRFATVRSRRRPPEGQLQPPQGIQNRGAGQLRQSAQQDEGEGDEQKAGDESEGEQKSEQQASVEDQSARSKRADGAAGQDSRADQRTTEGEPGGDGDSGAGLRAGAGGSQQERAAAEGEAPINETLDSRTAERLASSSVSGSADALSDVDEPVSDGEILSEVQDPVEKATETETITERQSEELTDFLSAEVRAALRDELSAGGGVPLGLVQGTEDLDGDTAEGFFLSGLSFGDDETETDTPVRGMLQLAGSMDAFGALELAGITEIPESAATLLTRNNESANDESITDSGLEAPAPASFGAGFVDAADVPAVLSRRGEDDARIGGSLYWVTARVNPAIGADAIAAEYSRPLFFRGEGSAGDVGSLEMSLSIDGATDINGAMTIENGPDVWTLGLIGGRDGPILELSLTDQSTVENDGDCAQGCGVEGDLASFLSGDSAEGLLGSFRFWQTERRSHFVTGIFGLIVPPGTIAAGRGIDTSLDQGSFGMLALGGEALGTGNLMAGPTLSDSIGDEAFFRLKISPEDYDPTVGLADLVGLAARRGESSQLEILADDAEHAIKAGVWRGEAPVALWQSASDGSGFSRVATGAAPAYWVSTSISETGPVGLPDLGGQAGLSRRFEKVLFADGTGSAGAIESFALSVDIAFDQSDYDASLLVANGGDQWDLSLQGSLGNATEQMSFLSTQPTVTSGALTDDGECSNGCDVRLNWRTMLARDAQALAGAFRIWRQGDTARFVTGVFGLEETDPRIGDSVDMNSGGIWGVTEGEPPLGRNISMYIGEASDGASGTPVFRDYASNAFGTVFAYVGGEQGIEDLGSDTIGGTQVNWGRWNAQPGDLVARTNIDSPEEQTEIAQRVAWIEADPANREALDAFRGTDAASEPITFENTVALYGRTGNGAINGGNASMTVDLAQGTVNGQLNFQSGQAATPWQVDYTGQVFGNRLRGQLDAVNVDGSPLSQLNGGVRGFLIGEPAQVSESGPAGAAGGFDVTGQGPSAQRRARGVFAVK